MVSISYVKLMNIDVTLDCRTLNGRRGGRGGREEKGEILIVALNYMTMIIDSALFYIKFGGVEICIK